MFLIYTCRIKFPFLLRYDWYAFDLDTIYSFWFKQSPSNKELSIYSFKISFDVNAPLNIFISSYIASAFESLAQLLLPI